MTRVSVKVISLSGSSDRRAVISKSLESFEFQWAFFDALSGDSRGDLIYDEGCALRYFGRPLSGNEIGCFKSHYTVLKNFINEEASEWMIVFEDDLLIDTKFDYGALIAYLSESGIDCLRLYCRRWKAADVVGYYYYRQLLRFRTDPYGIQSYIINKRAASAILANIRDIRRPIDDEIGRFWEHGVRIIGLFPFPVLETSAASTLQASRLEASRRTPTRLSDHAARLLLRSLDKVGKTTYNVIYPIFPRIIIPQMLRG